MIKKEKIIYKCICGKNFGNKKDNYIRHKNKINPCFGHRPNLLENTQNLSTNNLICINSNLNSNIQNDIKKDNKNDIKIEIKDDKNDIKIEIKDDIVVIKNNYECLYCKKMFERKYNCVRHIKTCKLNPDNDKFKIKPDKLDIIMQQNNELKNEIDKLKNQQINKNPTNININQQNNIINQSNILIGFDDVKLDLIDKKLFVQPIMNTKLFGKAIILQMIENIYINDEYPEYQNIMVTDKNRGYVKIYNKGKWKTDNINLINMVIDGIISHSKNVLVELKQQYLNNTNANSRICTSEKYIKLCDLEHLEDLEEEQINNDINNRDKIKRCKDFRDMVFKDTINLFHDNKKLLSKPA
jgi:hypothetical protein